MELFAPGGFADSGFGRLKPGDDLWVIAAKPADHAEPGNGDAAEHEFGVAGQRPLEGADRIAPERVIVGDPAVERHGGRGRAGERQPLLVLGHRSVPCVQRDTFSAERRFAKTGPDRRQRALASNVAGGREREGTVFRSHSAAARNNAVAKTLWDTIDRRPAALAAPSPRLSGHAANGPEVAREIRADQIFVRHHAIS